MAAPTSGGVASPLRDESVVASMGNQGGRAAPYWCLVKGRSRGNVQTQLWAFVCALLSKHLDQMAVGQTPNNPKIAVHTRQCI